MQMTLEDINRTYGGTYVGYRDGDVIKPVLVHSGVNDEDDECDYADLCTDDGRIELDNPNLVLDFPDVGMTQMGGECVWLMRRTERQWHRGIRERSFVETFGYSVHAIARSLYNPVTFKLSEYKDRESSRLSIMFKITRTGKIFFRDTAVAHYDGVTITATNHIAKLAIELEDWYDDSIGINIQRATA